MMETLIEEEVMVVSEMKVIEKMIEDRRKEYSGELVLNMVKDIEHLNIIKERQAEIQRAIEGQPLLRKIMPYHLTN